MAQDGKKKKKIKSVDTAFDIIELLRDQDRATMSEIVEDVGRSRSTTYYYLKTLEDRRYIFKEGKYYRLGLGFLNIGGKALGHIPLQGLGQQEAISIADNYNGVAHIAVEDRGKVITIYKTPNKSDIEDHSDLGTEVPLHTNAYGKAILANLSEQRRSEYFSSGDGSILSEQRYDEMKEELETYRNFGFAFSRDGQIYSLAAPISNPSNGEVEGTFGITKSNENDINPIKQFKAHRFKEDLTREIQHTSRIIADQLTR